MAPVQGDVSSTSREHDAHAVERDVSGERRRMLRRAVAPLDRAHDVVLCGQRWNAVDTAAVRGAAADNPSKRYTPAAFAVVSRPASGPFTTCTRVSRIGVIVAAALTIPVGVTRAFDGPVALREHAAKASVTRHTKMGLAIRRGS
jgi:hypothetical protein